MTVGIPDLPETTSPNNTDELLLNNNGNPRRVKVERVLALTGLDANEIETRISQNEINISSLQNSLDNILTENNLTLNDLPGVIGPNQINDGPGSGLNADLLDGIQATGFATSAQGARADSALQLEDFDPGTILGDSFRNASNLTAGTLSVDRLPAGVAFIGDIDNDDGTASTVYNSTITIRARNALTIPNPNTPGEDSFGLNRATDKTITIDHGNTSSQSSVLNSDSTVIQSISLDDYGHVTGLTSTTLSVSDNNDSGSSINNATITFNAGNALSGGGNFTTNQSTNETITINHADTSTQPSVNNSGSRVIQSVSLDGYGHVTGLVSETLTASDIGALAADGSENGNVTVKTTNSSFILTDPSDSTSNYFWKDNSDNTLKIGSDGAKVTLRSNLDATNKDLENVREINNTNVDFYAKLNQQQDVTARWLFENYVYIGNRNNNPADNAARGIALSTEGVISAYSDSGAPGKFGIPGNAAGNLIEFYPGGELQNFGGFPPAYSAISWTGSDIVYGQQSDYRLKENITILSEVEAITAIQNYQPKKFNFKGYQKEKVGFIAHEFAQVTPNYVSNEKDAVDQDGNPIYQGMQAGNPKTIAELVKVCQYLISENEELKNRVEILENS